MHEKEDNVLSNLISISKLKLELQLCDNTRLIDLFVKEYTKNFEFIKKIKIV
jgi:hypothetical protein